MPGFRDRPNVPVDQRCTLTAMRALARRIEHLDTEVDDHHRAPQTLLDQAAPQLLAERGIGYAPQRSSTSRGPIPVAATAGAYGGCAQNAHRGESWNDGLSQTRAPGNAGRVLAVSSCPQPICLSGFTSPRTPTTTRVRSRS